MSKKELLIIAILAAAFFGLLLIETAPIADTVQEAGDTTIRLPNGHEVYRHDEEDSICFYTKHRALSCQGK